MPKPQVEFENVVCDVVTDKAIHVIIDGDPHWIPSSQVTDDSEVWRMDDEGTLVITEWWAEKEGLI